jgi:hypothetical protein
MWLSEVHHSQGELRATTGQEKAELFMAGKRVTLIYTTIRELKYGRQKTRVVLKSSSFLCIF